MGRKKIKPEIITKDVNKMCELVNEKYGLLPNQRGSIEFSKLLKNNGVLRFEDILEEVREKFNDEYFKEV